MSEYYLKYLKYKTKYINLKYNQHNILYGYNYYHHNKFDQIYYNQRGAGFKSFCAKILRNIFSKKPTDQHQHKGLIESSKTVNITDSKETINLYNNQNEQCSITSSSIQKSLKGFVLLKDVKKDGKTIEGNTNQLCYIQDSVCSLIYGNLKYNLEYFNMGGSTILFKIIGDVDKNPFKKPLLLKVYNVVYLNKEQYIINNDNNDNNTEIESSIYSKDGDDNDIICFIDDDQIKINDEIINRIDFNKIAKSIYDIYVDIYEQFKFETNVINNIMTVCDYKITRLIDNEPPFIIFVNEGISIKEYYDANNKQNLYKNKCLTSSLVPFIKAIAKFNKNYIHCDMKNQNVTINDAGIIKMIDLDSIVKKIDLIYCNENYLKNYVKISDENNFGIRGIDSENNCLFFPHTIYTIPMELLFYLSKIASIQSDGNDIIKKNLYASNIFSDNDKINYIGIFNIIVSLLYDVSLEERKNDKKNDKKGIINQLFENININMNDDKTISNLAIDNTLQQFFIKIFGNFSEHYCKNKYLHKLFYLSVIFSLNNIPDNYPQTLTLPLTFDLLTFSNFNFNFTFNFTFKLYLYLLLPFDQRPSLTVL